MTIEQPMFPPRRNNPFRIVGGFETAGSEKPIANRRGRVIDDEPELPPMRNDWRTREGVKKHIAKHVEARAAYAKAVAWTAAAEAQKLPLAQIEQAHLDTFHLYQEMQECARSLVICMPTDPRALVDLLMYLEKHFTTLPQEVNGRSLAFDLLRTVRLSLRAVARYGKYDKDDDE
jgi:hypothetical protein